MTTKLTKSEAGKLGSIKSVALNKVKLEQRINDYNSNPKVCKHCGKPLPYFKRRNTFCNSSCAASYNNPTSHKKNKETKVCLNCGKEFIPKYSSQGKYCSNKCQNEYQHSQVIKLWKEGLYDGVIGKAGISAHIRYYMLEKFKYRCSKCGWHEVNPTAGKVPLEVHHKDGDFTNNNEDNLEVLCPNCHSLTNNYKNNGSRTSKRNRN